MNRHAPFSTSSPSRRDVLRRTCGLAGGGLAALAVLTAPATSSAQDPATRGGGKSSDKPRIRIGQIGTAHAHATKLAVYRRSPDYEVVGIVERDAARRAEAENQPAFRGLKWMAEDELLNAPGLQAVLVETRVQGLLGAAARCVTAGKHICLDKPPGNSLPRLRVLLEEAERKKLLVQMGYMLRYNPAVALLRRFVREGWLGDVFEIDGVMSKVVGPAERKTLAERPGGMMFELGCHLIDLLVDVAGKPERVHPFLRRSAKGAPDALEDNTLAVFEYPRATATIRSSALEVGGTERRQFVVCGTQGTFEIRPLEPPAARYTLDRDRGEYEKGAHELNVGPYERYVADAADMAKVIRGEKAPDWSYAHDLAVQEAVLRASGIATGG